MDQNARKALKSRLQRNPKRKSLWPSCPSLAGRLSRHEHGIRFHDQSQGVQMQLSHEDVRNAKNDADAEGRVYEFLDGILSIQERDPTGVITPYELLFLMDSLAHLSNELRDRAFCEVYGSFTAMGLNSMAGPLPITPEAVESTAAMLDRGFRNTIGESLNDWLRRFEDEAKPIAADIARSVLDCAAPSSLSRITGHCRESYELFRGMEVFATVILYLEAIAGRGIEFAKNCRAEELFEDFLKGGSQLARILRPFYENGTYKKKAITTEMILSEAAEKCPTNEPS